MFSGKGKNEFRTAIQISILSGVGGLCMIPFLPSYGLIFLGIGLTTASYYLMRWTKYDIFFRNARLGVEDNYPQFKSLSKTPTSVIYHFSLPAGMSTEDFEKKKLALEQYINRKVEISYDYKELLIEEYLSDKQQFYDYNYYQYTGAVSFALGYDTHKQLVACDLSDGSDGAHMLIAGTTGSGKSVVVKSVVTSLILAQKSQLYLVDLKGCELSIFQDYNTVQGFCSDLNSAEDTLSYILGEMQRRYNVLQTTRKKDIAAYNSSYADKMQHIVVVIDEFAELGGTRNQVTVERISSLGRAAGIHLIIATQRPDRDVFSPRIKANCNVVLGLKTSTPINSRVIFDNDDLIDLYGNGNGILRFRGVDVKLQAFNIKNKQIEQLLKPYKMIKPKINKNNEMIIDSEGELNIYDIEKG